MGLVRFFDGSGEEKLGYLIEGEVFDLSETIGEEVETLGELQKLVRLISESDRDFSTTRVEAVELLPPTNPSKVVRLDGCYEHDLTDEGFDPHLEGVGLEDLSNPSLWVAPTSTLTGDASTVQIPPQVEDVRPGVELGIVIGERGKQLDPQETNEIISGFVACMSLRSGDDIPGLYGYKMFDGFFPCGPSVVPYSRVDADALSLGVRRNRNAEDTQSTTSLRFTIPEMVSFASHVMTLEPGDLIATGTPNRGISSLEDGDEVEAWIESIGTLQVTIDWDE
jgi:2-keto-4-pentenoate hydratase/2-oxohepta-3-ene-1,7-dioic acid hydratase in catechol pathway